ncbi:unnamed protein product, partial [Mesorhabditis belari]|uniref:ShKT domain-containing protein n=1 Tax=Mesorhabditis belari TaxID=2138241 RepID=A0AAF3E8E7_9BILA
MHRLLITLSSVAIAVVFSTSSCPDLAVMCPKNTMMCGNNMYGALMKVYCVESCGFACDSNYRGCADAPGATCSSSACTPTDPTGHYNMVVNCSLTCGNCQPGSKVAHINQRRSVSEPMSSEPTGAPTGSSPRPME